MRIGSFDVSGERQEGMPAKRRGNDGESRPGASAPAPLPSGNCADDEERFCARSYRRRQRRVRWVEREVLLAGEKAQERTALEGHVIPDGPAQHGIASLQRI